MLLVDFNLLHLLLYLLELHLLLAVLCHLLHLGHPHSRLLLLAVVVGIDGVPLSRVGAVLWLRAVERHNGVLDVLVSLLGNQAGIKEKRRLGIGRAKARLTVGGLSPRVGKWRKRRCPLFSGRGIGGGSTLHWAHEKVWGALL